METEYDVQQEAGAQQDSGSMLKELVLATVLCGVLICLITVWFADDKPAFLLSMAVGVLGAAAMAFHISRSIEYALEMPEDSAGKYMRNQSFLRMAGVFVLALAAYWLKGDVVVIFLGLISLKPGAYVQPLIHRLLHRNHKKGR